ncbi:hypothetical protein H4S04_005574 [Coemansia sp. S16]|nr:hypothetical protein GGI08_007487 [Coemansia sp. S2]KAJ2045548.1 hypothetical protein H4S04_005574 [Coemansia sp. S16]
MAAHFWPAMWEQRRICIARALYEHKVRRVLEVGCGDGNILSFLVAPASDDEHPIRHLYGIDISADALGEARNQLEPTDQDRRDLRVDELRVELFHGSAMASAAPIAIDAVICSEVIEHVQESEVPALTHAVLGVYRPRLAVFTTPNAEFNVNFPGLCYGTPEARFRDADHKFEWTRAEFTQWAQNAAEYYGYQVELRGIGMTMRNTAEGFVPCGGCSQMALFVRQAEGPKEPPPGYVMEPCPGLVPFADIEYPVYAQPPPPEEQLLELVLDFARLVADAQSAFDFSDLWSVLEVRHHFKRRRALETWLLGNPLHFKPASQQDRQPAQRYTLVGA